MLTDLWLELNRVQSVTLYDDEDDDIRLEARSGIKGDRSLLAMG